MRTDDPLGTAQAVQEGDSQHHGFAGRAGSLAHRLTPELFHHHLEEGCFDPELVGLFKRPGLKLPLSLSRLAEHDSTHLDLLDHPGDESIFDGDLARSRASASVVHVERFADGILGVGLPEVVEPERVGQEVGNPALEAVELAQTVLADGDQEVRVDVVAVHGPGELRLEPVRAGVGRVVEEIFLELVEDEEERDPELGPAPGDELIQRQAGVDDHVLVRHPGQGLEDSSLEGDPERRVLPVAEDDHGGARVFLEIRDHAGQQDRALAHAAGAVEHGQRSCIEVRGDNRDVTYSRPKRRSSAILLGVRLEADM